MNLIEPKTLPIPAYVHFTLTESGDWTEEVKDFFRYVHNVQKKFYDDLEISNENYKYDFDKDISLNQSLSNWGEMDGDGLYIDKGINSFMCYIDEYLFVQFVLIDRNEIVSMYSSCESLDYILHHFQQA